MEPTRPASVWKRWRISLPVSMGVVLLLASLAIAPRGIRTHAGDNASYTASSAKPADDPRWMSLGYVDVEGGVTSLYPLQQGRVKSVAAAENKEVKAGSPLFYLEDTVQTLKVRQAKADLEGARQKLAAAEANVNLLDQKIAVQQQAIAKAQVDVQRAQNQLSKNKRFMENKIAGDPETVRDSELLLQEAEIGVVAKQRELAAMEATRPQLQAAVKGARVEIDAKQAQLDEAQNAVNECVVRAPCDGTPLRILVSVGQTLGSNPRQPAIQFAPKRALLVRGEIGQEFVGRARKGQFVLIEDHVTGQNCAQGKVVSLAQWYAPRRSSNPELIQMSNDAPTLECIIQIESTKQELRIGQRVRIQFPGSEK